jgi:hypothetical protein
LGLIAGSPPSPQRVFEQSSIESPDSYEQAVERGLFVSVIAGASARSQAPKSRNVLQPLSDPWNAGEPADLGGKHFPRFAHDASSG